MEEWVLGAGYCWRSEEVVKGTCGVLLYRSRLSVSKSDCELAFNVLSSELGSCGESTDWSDLVAGRRLWVLARLSESSFTMERAGVRLGWEVRAGGTPLWGCGGWLCGAVGGGGGSPPNWSETVLGGRTLYHEEEGTPLSVDHMT